MLQRCSWARLLLAAGLFSTACSTEEVRPTGPFQTVMVGRVGDASEETVVAVAIDGDALTAYACGGPDTVASNTHWWTGKVTDGVFHVTSDGLTIDGTREGSAASGTIETADGRVLAWDVATPTSEIGGLYVDADAGCRAGVVVLPGNTDAGPTIQGSACSDSGTRLQVTPVMPVDPETQEMQVTVELGTAVRKLTVERLAF